MSHRAYSCQKRNNSDLYHTVELYTDYTQLHLKRQNGNSIVMRMVMQYALSCRANTSWNPPREHLSRDLYGAASTLGASTST